MSSQRFYAETGSTDPAFNLAFEETILRTRPEGDWLLLWQNDNTVVIGRNQNVAEEVNLDFAKEHDVRIVRRETGGGAVYHDLGNLNYSFITDLGDPETLSIRRFTEPVCRVLASLGVEAETSGRNDITIDGRKVSGTAQRVYHNRILHHGTLLFDSDSDRIAAVLNVDPSKFVSKSAKSVRSRVLNIRSALPHDMTLDEFRERLKNELLSSDFKTVCLSDEELRAVEELAETKYRSWDWTWGHYPHYAFHNKARFPGGTFEVNVDVQNGLISDIVFSGDYMAVSDQEEIMEALRGSRFDRESLSALLESFDLSLPFGGITADNILDLLFP